MSLGIIYKWGQKSSIKRESLASIQESLAKTLTQIPWAHEQGESDTSFDSSMATEGIYALRVCMKLVDISLEKFKGVDDHGNRICMDNQGRFLAKGDEHLSLIFND